ncbi:hypothetical protein PG987_003011 [Apiospora arundinis]
MNNEQFRRLVGGNTPKPSTDSSESTPARSLGSRQKSSIPMTPRSVGFSRNDFQRQLAERNQADKPQKKHRTSAPKGSRLAAGYVDRTKAREDEEADSRAVRIKALEESLKKEEIDQETFDRLRFEIAGGDLSSTHLVKGLDFKLLERVRKGEDVYGGNANEPDPDEKEEEEGVEEAEVEDVDEAFEELESTNVEAIAREKEAKKGQFATGGPKPGQKRTRDMILAELKAARDAANAKNKSALGNKFKKIGDKPTPGSSRIERDSKGREVLIVVDEDGHEKRKIRKIQPHDQAKAEAEAEAAREAMMPDKDAKPLGMEVPDIYKPKPEEEDEKEVDIFDDVGDDYDPLAGLGGDSDEDSDEDEGETTNDASTPAEKIDRAAMPPPPRPATTSEPRNYFKDSKTKLVSSEELKAPSMSDPAIAAAFKRAAALKAIPKASDDEEDEEARAKAERHRKMLQNVDRDAEDMDMGFGMSRFEDEADLDDSKVELSEWGIEDDKDGKQGADGKAKRKRGGKKRKGDANSVADVMRVMEQRKTAG